MNNHELKKYIGNEFQDAGAMRICIADGKASNARAVLLENRSGLSMTLLEDRCLDIYSLKIKGYNIPFLSKCGVVHPSYYDAAEWEFLRSFGVGFLTTCGLSQAGEPCRFDNSNFGGHGVISNTPAADVAIKSSEDEIEVSGEIREYKFQTVDLILKRSITLNKSKNQIGISDSVTNEGWRDAPFMLLYHFNFGYPLVNPETRVLLPPANIEGWDDYSSGIIDRHLEMEPPGSLYEVQTYIHKLANPGKETGFSIMDNRENPKMAVDFRYETKNLPYITQWKHFKPSEYVMAVEPCNNHVKGLEWEAGNGTLQLLRPGENRSMRFTINFYDDLSEIKKKIIDVAD